MGTNQVQWVAIVVAMIIEGEPHCEPPSLTLLTLNRV